MTILEDIRLKHVDSSETLSDLSYSNRILEIHTDRGKITTPARLTTNSEITARSQIPLSTSIPMDCCVSFKPLNSKFMTDFSTNVSGTCSSLIRSSIQFNDLTKRAVLRLSIFQPAMTALESMTTESKIRFAEIQAKYLQFLMGSNIVTYPYLKLPASDYINFIEKHDRMDEEVSAVFTLDMGMEEASFKKVIDYLLAKRRPALIALIYRNWKNYVGQYEHIASKSNENRVAFIACQVRREDNHTKLNKLHEMIHHSFDLVALEQRQGGEPSEPDLNKIRIFSPKRKSFDGVVDALEESGRDMAGELEIPPYNLGDQDLVRQMIEGYRGAGISPDKFQKWCHLAHFHELIASKREFLHAQNAIRIGETAEYIMQSNLNRSVAFKTFQ